MANTQSKIKLLEELNSKLQAENTELRKENAKVKRENAELRQSLESHEARITKLEQGEKSIANVSQSPVNINSSEMEISNDAPISDITDNALASNISVNASNSNDVHEQIVTHNGKSVVSSHETQSVISLEIVSASGNSDIQQELETSTSPIPTETISLEEKEENEFLDSTYRKQVSKEIIQSIREKKLRDQNADLSLVNQTDTTSEILESDDQIVEGLIQEMTYNQAQNIVSSGINPSSNNAKIDFTEISKSCIQDMIPGSAQSLSDLFDKAIKSGQKQILCWYYYSLEFENKVKSLTGDGKIKDKTARSQIYKEMKPFLPTITDANLRKKTQRARKILTLFGEGGVGVAKIKQISYSARTISGLTNAQIQYVINQVTSKTVTIGLDRINVEVSDLTKTLISNSSDSKVPPISKPKEDLPESKKTLSEKQNNPVHTHANFRNKTLEQYPDIFYEYSNEGVDYYGINSESLCPICKLNHEDGEGVEGNYEAGSYYIKCEASEIDMIQYIAHASSADAEIII